MDIAETAARLLPQGPVASLGAEVVVGQAGDYGANNMLISAVEPARVAEPIHLFGQRVEEGGAALYLAIVTLAERVDEGVAEFVPDDL